MRLELRETASIRVSARKDEVMDVLERRLRGSARTAPDRIESDRSTYVVREDAPGSGAQVFHMRRERATVGATGRGREELRRAVRSDLFELQQLFSLRE